MILTKLLCSKARKVFLQWPDIVKLIVSRILVSLWKKCGLIYIWLRRARTNSRHQFTRFSTQTQNFKKCIGLSQNHFGSAYIQFSFTCLFVFQLTGGSSAPLKAMLCRSPVSVFIVPNRLQFKWMITTKSVILINLRKTRWSPKECACGLRVRRLSSRQLVVHACRSHFAVFRLSNSESGLRIASSEAISSSSALMSFN